MLPQLRPPGRLGRPIRQASERVSRVSWQHTSPERREHTRTRAHLGGVPSPPTPVEGQGDLARDVPAAALLATCVGLSLSLSCDHVQLRVHRPSFDDELCAGRVANGDVILCLRRDAHSVPLPVREQGVPRSPMCICILHSLRLLLTPSLRILPLLHHVGVLWAQWSLPT